MQTATGKQVIGEFRSTTAREFPNRGSSLLPPSHRRRHFHSSTLMVEPVFAASYFFQHGTLYESKEPSPEVIAFVKSKRVSDYPMGRCYWNARRLTLEALEAGLTASYVEGLAVRAEIIPTTVHAWNIIEGVVVDSTWGTSTYLTREDRSRVRRDEWVVGVIPDPLKYLGVEFPLDLVKKFHQKHGRTARRANRSLLPFLQERQTKEAH
jgi:hypothetical protein